MTAPRPTGISAQVWAIALPAMLTNLATALFGLADMWAIGQIGDASAQGAVELGAKYMLGLLNVFNFLRTSTVALTAQAGGSGQSDASAQTLVRAIAAALAIGVLLLIVMPWSVPFGLDLLGAQDRVRIEAAAYVGIRYWAAPVWLANCVLVGWLVGQRMMRPVLVVEVTANAVHIALDLLLVLALHMGVSGVGLATFGSELLKFALLAFVVLRRPAAREALACARHRATWSGSALRHLFALNRDLFVRTLLLTAAMLLFARSGARAGPVRLAANGILFQLFMMSTLIIDGFESAAQVLCGEAVGGGNAARLRVIVRNALAWGTGTGAAMAVLYALGGATIAGWFSTDPVVGREAVAYLPWVVALPLAGVASFVFDGVFVGAGWTRAMLLTMAAAMALYIALLQLAAGWGNHGLWAAFTAFFLARALGQALVMPRLVRTSFGPG